MKLRQVASFAFDAVDRDAGMAWALAVALSVRLLLIPWFSDPLNFYGIKETSSFAEAGYNPWVVIASDPALSRLNPWGYPPLYLLPVVTASVLSLGDGFVFGLIVRLPLVAADVLAGAFIFKTGRVAGLSEGRARGVAVAYLFNPFVILVSAVWGVNDALPVLMVSAATYFLLRSPARFDLSALLLGLGIAFKIYPIVFVPLVLAVVPGWGARLRYLALAAIPGAATAGPVLLSSPREFLGTLGAFTTGIGAGPVDLHLSTWWVFADAGLSIGPEAILYGFALFGVFTAAVAFLVGTKRLSFLRGATLVILALFLASPRYNHNYFLWALYFVTLSAGVEPWRRVGRAVGLLAWVPLTVHALIYNGIAVAKGLFYWALITTGLFLKPDKVAGPDVRRWLVSVYLLAIAVAGLTLLIESFRRRQASPAPPEGKTAKLLRPPPRPVRRSAELLAAAAIGFVLLSAGLGVVHVAVTPETFGNYEIVDSRVTVKEDFAGALLDFTWTFEGPGIYVMDPSGSGRIVMDSVRLGWFASIERLVPDSPIHLRFNATLEEIYGEPGFILLLRVPAGWLGVLEGEGAGRGNYTMVFYDEVQGARIPLAPFHLGTPFEVSIDILPNMTKITYTGAVLTAAGRSPISNVRIGHTDPFLFGGGRLAIDWIELSWPNPIPPPNGAFTATILLASIGALAAPVVWWRTKKS